MGTFRVVSRVCGAVVAASALAACGVSGGTSQPASGNAAPAAGPKTTDPAYLAMAKEYVDKVTTPGTPWTGPTTGPTAQGKKLVVYVSSDQRNGGPQGAGDGAKEAAQVIGWDFRILDGQGSVQGRTTALNQAIALKPAGIILGNVDTLEQMPVIEKAAQMGIKLVGWHATAAPGPIASPPVFTNVTTDPKEVARAAAYFAVLFTLSPPALTLYSITPMGFHSESIFFTGLSLCLLFNILDGRRTSWLAYTALGVSAGLGTWFTYIYAISWLAMLAYWFWRDRESAWNPKLAATAVGFLVGFSPWIAETALGHYNAFVIAGGRDLRHLFTWRTFVENFGGWRDWGVSRVALSFMPPLWPLDGYARPNIFYGAFIAVLACGWAIDRMRQAGAWLRRMLRCPPPEALIFIYLGLLAICLQACLTGWAFRYRAPAMPFLLWLIAWLLDRLAEFGSRGTWVRVSLVWVLAAGGLVFNGLMLTMRDGGGLQRVAGYDYFILPGPAQKSVEAALAYYDRTAPGLGTDDLFNLANGVAKRIAEDVRADAVSDVVRRVGHAADRPLNNLVDFWAGDEEAQRAHEWRRALEDTALIMRESPHTAALLLLGLERGFGLEMSEAPTLENASDTARVVPPDAEGAVWRAAGLRFTRESWSSPTDAAPISPRLLTALGRVPAQDQTAFVEGVGGGLFAEGDPTLPASGGRGVLVRHTAGLPPDLQRALCRGAGAEWAIVRLGNIEYYDHVLSMLLRGLTADNVSSFREGRDATTRLLRDR